ncbi:hypothetical protein GNI_094930 [Gregarina niphandrodes]|uniref:C3H1-type domain-containing protein n=1 Tax=Gregarina niphandrodes TaxID=110365 RepID=A0A023B527_GRENI|nr:hypothetical protein GNI_094930 [Gregarina niphandrodes]EZG58339.1 hypothetical protein GNI_094930 [Gregarina niphandrodes]|eukprot:XP_011130972.1 hypothetical protein GNI_094930 [Gregarina niphandrodes]
MTRVSFMDLVSFGEGGLELCSIPHNSGGVNGHIDKSGEAKCSQELLEALRAAREGQIDNEVDPIVPGFLYIGSSDRCRDARTMARLGIGAIVSLVQPEFEYDVVALEHTGVRIYCLEIPDTVDYAVIKDVRACLQHLEQDLYAGDMTKYTPEITIDSIDRTGSSQHHDSTYHDSTYHDSTYHAPGLFVHCHKGLSRSAVFVLAILLYRIYLVLPDPTAASNIAVGTVNFPSPDELLERIIVRCRRIMPNVSFRSQINLLYECLCSLRKRDPFSHMFDRKNLISRRRCEFFFVCKFLETYLAVKGRCLAECWEYVSNNVVRKIPRLIETVTKCNPYTMWVRKSSPIRKTWPWIMLGVQLDLFLLYQTRIPLGTHSHQSQEKSFAKNSVLVNNRYKRNDTHNGGGDGTKIRDDRGDSRYGLTYDGLPKNASKIPTTVQDFCLTDHGLVDSESGSNLLFPFTLPDTLLWSAENGESRHELIAYCLGLGPSPVLQKTDKWTISTQLDNFRQNLFQCKEKLTSFVNKHGLRSWSMFLARMICIKCDFCLTEVENELEAQNVLRLAEESACQAESNEFRPQRRVPSTASKKSAARVCSNLSLEHTLLFRAILSGMDRFKASLVTSGDSEAATANSGMNYNANFKIQPADDGFHQLLTLEELALFRTQLCDAVCKGACPLPDRCASSHCLTWQRRNPLLFFYSATLCPEIEFIRRNNRMTLVRKCNRGRQCPYAHSKEEELYHPMIYKTKLCRAQPNCKRYFCPFAHSPAELKPRMTLEKYQTILQQRGKPASPASHVISAASTEACSQTEIDRWRLDDNLPSLFIDTPPREGGARSPVSSPTIFFQTAPDLGDSPLRAAPGGSPRTGSDREYENLWREIALILAHEDDDDTRGLDLLIKSLILSSQNAP